MVRDGGYRDGTQVNGTRHVHTALLYLYRWWGLLCLMLCNYALDYPRVMYSTIELRDTALHCTT